MARTRNQLRIIGGAHRGQRVHFPDGRGLRPTADRVRETLFNWLQGELAGRRVLDLFAGSGALGLEALSRGAGQAVFVERARAPAAQLRANLERLGLEQRAEVLCMDAQRFLRQARPPFDLVFLDPPFADARLASVAAGLEAGGLLARDAWIYLERDAASDPPELPEHWRLHREGRAGQAAFALMYRNG
jgi:16S rRNA (guanine966-N2)-methyltransferase